MCVFECRFLFRCLFCRDFPAIWPYHRPPPSVSMARAMFLLSRGGGALARGAMFLLSKGPLTHAPGVH